MSEPNVMVVVADISGSMREHGKAMLARNLICHIRNLKRLSGGPGELGEPRVILWEAEASEVELLAEEDLPPFRVGGYVRVKPLLKVLERLAPSNGRMYILLLSDGHIARPDVTVFKAWKHRSPGVSVRALALGPDTASAALKKMADHGGVFPAEEVGCALASWTLPRDPELPISLDEVMDKAARGRQ